MATLPGATNQVVDTAAAAAKGADVCCVFAPVPIGADSKPRQFGSASAIYAVHGYSEGVEYAALHADATGKPLLFCGLPIATPGTVGSHNTEGNSGTSVTTVSVGSYGSLTEHEGVVSVLTGGTIGTSQIVLGLSLDGGVTTKRVRLGTASSYTIPYVGVVIAFAAGTLVAGDTIHTWTGTGPRSDASGWIAARQFLAAQQKQHRSIILIGDVQDNTEAAAFLAQLDAYETANTRYVYGRASLPDRLPQAALSARTVRMTGAPSVTFAEVGVTGDTITRSAGSFVSDGFVSGMIATISGSTGNDATLAAGLVTVAATVLTLGADDLLDEGPSAGVTITATTGLTFSDSADTIVRTDGSWLADGFRVGQTITVADTVSNNGDFLVTAVTGLTLSVEAADLADEVIGASAISITTGQAKAVWMAALDAAFASIDGAPRIDLSAGRGRVLSPFTAWQFRRPASWAASLREYQHDVHIATWRKSDGPTGFSLWDTDNNLVEWDDAVDGGAGSAARFTTLRSWSNGPGGAFVTLSLTRADDSSLLSRTHNVAVVNVAQQVVQAGTENAAIGVSVLLNADGTATSDSLASIASQVNAGLEQALLKDASGEGQRASQALWVPAADDILNVAEPLLNGVLTLNLRGTIHRVETQVRLSSGGQ